MSTDKPHGSSAGPKAEAATSLLLISGFKFLAARSQMGIESTPYGERA
jgi:hypothetical protein